MIYNQPCDPSSGPDFIKMTSPLDFVQRDDCRHSHHQRNVAEVEQTSEIRDNFGVMRFKVMLQRAFPQIDEPSCSIDLEQFKDKKLHCGFEVVVISYMYDAEGTILVDDEFGRLDIATRAYEDNVKKYSLIAQVETSRVDDIKIYADKIGYRPAAECCASCRWGCQKSRKLVCSNWKQFAKRVSDLQCPETQQFKVMPEVKPECVCNSFQRKLPPRNPSEVKHCYDQYGDCIGLP